MTDRPQNEGAPGPDAADLDHFFAAARAQRPEPGVDLLARIAAEAEATAAARARPGPASARANGRQGRSGVWLGDWLAAIGGWPAVAGLATATVAGLWIGYAQPHLGAMTLGTGTDEATYDLGGLLPGYVAADEWNG
ncbi:dihydroorotate dehydrogenase [Palleronia sp. KMU-117]|uniref:dihydroorotate dehydrogenase n=1 Tax=Palleronia sp. KMU-117 TaxID=3434108 RepID=UPI003D752581